METPQRMKSTNKMLKDMFPFGGILCCASKFGNVKRRNVVGQKWL
jgi:hypothetical protein